MTTDNKKDLPEPKVPPLVKRMPTSKAEDDLVNAGKRKPRMGFDGEGWTGGGKH